MTGSGGLTKTNSGTLTILTTNDYTGRTVIGGGTVSVVRLAGGNAPSGIGASSKDPTNLVFAGGALSYTGSTTTIDRGATLNDSGTFDIANATTSLTNFGNITGSGGLVKTGPGTLVIMTNNNYTGGTLISNGTIALGTTFARNDGLGTGTTSLRGGILRLYGYAGGTGTDWGGFNDPLNIPTNLVGTILAPPRYTMSSSLSGGGRLNLTVDYVRGQMNGNWSSFMGEIVVTGRVANSEFRVNNTAGYSNASFFLTDNVIMNRTSGSGGAPATIRIGALGGTVGARLAPGNESSGGPHWSIGWNDRDATFAGSIRNDGSSPLGTAVTKVGTGTWTLTGTNTYALGTIINGGTVLVNNPGGSGLGSGAITVNNTAMLGGTGFITAPITISSGGTLAPGTSIGTLTINNNLTLNAGSASHFELGATNASDKVVVSGTLSSGGTLHLTSMPGFGPGTYILFTCGSLNGAPPAIGTAPSGFNYSVNTNTPNQIRLVVVQIPPAIESVSSSGNGVTLGGSGGLSNATYYVLASTNLLLPASEWTRISTNTFDSNGAFSSTQVVDPALPHTYYRIQLQ
jgi:fibronectin-binding autotransporter adhesin